MLAAIDNTLSGHSFVDSQKNQKGWLMRKLHRVHLSQPICSLLIATIMPDIIEIKYK